VVAAAHRIGSHPQLGVIRPGLAPEDVRFLVVGGFPYVIVYRWQAEPPRILRVLHGARDLEGTLRDMFGGG
jgi:plasmid stabilization system protein ParE